MPTRVVKWQEIREMEQRAIQARKDRFDGLEARIDKFMAAVVGFELISLKYMALDSDLSRALLPRLTKDGLGSGRLSRLLRNLVSNQSGFLRTRGNPLARIGDIITVAEILGSTLYLPGGIGTPGGDPIPPSDWQSWPYDMSDSHWYYEPYPRY